MEIRNIGEKRTIIIKVTGELDHHMAAKIKDEADKKMRSTNAVNVIFDLSEMTFMDSAGLGVMMGRYKKARTLGGKTAVYGTNAQTLRIIKMSGMDRVIKIVPCLEKAIRYVEKDKGEIYNG